MDLNHDGMMRFAADWIANWNRRDVEAVLAHFAEEAEFTSPLARTFAGRSVLRGKAELETYWRAGLERIKILQFILDRAFWDERRRVLVVLYDANLNGERKRACEVMTFNAEGRQVRGEAMYGALI